MQKDSSNLFAAKRDMLRVSEMLPLDELLKLFLSKRAHIALVVDEFGGSGGLVMLDDVLDQVVGEIYDEFDEVEGFNDRLLIGAVDLGLQEIVGEVQRLGGLNIASHVDRPSFGIIGQLGFIPPDLGLDALEFSRGGMGEEVSVTRELPVVTSSDAHFLHDVGRICTPFFLESPNLKEIRMALQGKDGRKVTN